MKRKFTHFGFILFLFLGISFGANAQVQVGFGTETDQSLPIEPSKGYTYSQVIYLASEVYTSGTITELQWYFDGSSLMHSNDWTIYIGHTGKTEFSSADDWVPVANMTQVYSATFPDITAPGWITFDITDWAYNGTDNIVVAVDENEPGNDATVDFYCTAVTDNRGLERHEYSINPDPENPPLGSLRSYIANIIFGGITQSCPFPTDQTETNITATSVELGWTESGSATTWNIEYGSTGFTQGSGTMISGTTDNPYTLSGLTSYTTYDWYVQADCGGGDESLWVGPSTFTTDCDVYTAPFTEHFASSSTPDCWGNTGPDFWRFNTSAHGGASAAGDHTAGGGTNYAWVQNPTGTSSNELLTPFIDVSALTTPWFKFYYFSNNTDYPGENNTLTVDFWDGAAWNNLLTYAGDNPAWQKGLYDLSGYSITGDVQFRFVISKMPSGYPFFNDILIDDISVASCFQPVGQTETNITASSADLGWTPGETETTWNIEWGPTGFTLGGGTMISGTTDNPYTLTGLTSNTTYDWYVQADCGGGEESSWTGPGTFTTACSTYPTPFSEDFTSSDTPACWDNPGPKFWEFSTSAGYGAGAAGDHTAGGGTNFAKLHSPSGASSNELVTPYIDVSGLTTPEFKFYYFSNNTNTEENNSLTVDFWDGAAWNNLLTYAGNEGLWQVGIYDLSNYTITGDVQFRFIVGQMPSGYAGYNDILIDDVSVDEAPSCHEPTDLTEDNITDVSADLNWTENSSATKWNIEWGPAGFTPGSGNMITGITFKPYSLTGLTMNTEYDWYIQTHCGIGNESAWSAGSRFTTTCGVTTVPYFEDFDGVTNPDFPACMTVENTNGDAYEWVTNNSFALSPPNAARIQYNSSLPMDDWFFTAGLQLTGGTTYEVSFAYAVQNTVKTEKLAVDWGNAAASTAMSGTPIFDDSYVNNTSWEAGSGTFTPTTSGTYYVGFHGYSNANQWTLNVDDVKVLEAVATTTWAGTVDNDWDKPGNWSNGIPTLSTDVTIPSGLTNYPTVSSFGLVNDITIQSDASLVGVDKLTVDGTATVERNIPAYSGNGDGTHHLSSPVSAFTIAGSDFEPVAGDDDFYEWDETTALWLNYIGGTFGDTEFEVGKGYLVAYKTTNPGVFTGNLNTSSVTKNPTYHLNQGNGWNLLGNPYPSAIDWDLITKSADVYGVVYVLNGSDNEYDIWNGSTGSLTDGHIPINNGFFIKVGSTGQSVTIDPADQVHGNSGFLKKENSEGPENTLIVSITNSDFSSSTYVQFRPDASLAFDKAIDGYKLFGKGVGPQLFTRQAETDYSINCVPFSTDEFDLNMGFVTKTAGIYTLSSTGANTFQDSKFEVELEDLLMAKKVNLATESYTFSADKEGNEDRFVLHFYSITGIWDSPVMTSAQIYGYNKTIYIKFDQVPADVSQVEVFNTYGQLVYSADLTPATLSHIKLNARPGIYVVRLRNGSGLKTQKVSLR